LKNGGAKKMADTSIPDYPRGITFEQVWAALMEDRKRAEEYRKQHEEDWKRAGEYRKQHEEDRKKHKEDWERINEGFERLRKRQEENAKLQKETDRLIKETGKRMGYLNNRFGELAEHLVAPGIKKRFNELGYHFDSIAPGGYRIVGEDGRDKTEIDILLENGEAAIAVEVKVKPSVKDVEHHIKRLEILREHRNKRNDARKILGAIAGAIFGLEEKKATLDAGMYVIEQSGDTMKIDIPHDFIPREW
jgi:predicted nuclease with TOPRIM domain